MSRRPFSDIRSSVPGAPAAPRRIYTSGILAADVLSGPEFEPDLPPARGADPAFALAAAATFFLLLAAAEAASRGAARSGFWYRRFDFSGTVSSVPELQDRIRWAGRQSRPAFLLGDSVLGASALLEHGTPGARRAALASQLREQAGRRGRHVESLAADGMLLPDLEGVARLLHPAAPPRTLLLLNVRMFAAEFENPAKALSREFLAGALPSQAVPLRPGIERTLPDRAFEHSSLLRSTAMLKCLWYFPTRRDFFRRAVEGLLGADGDADLQEAALRLKVAGYYTGHWKTSSASFVVLDRLLQELAGTNRAVVVLTPQNPDFVESPETLRANRSVLASFVRSRVAGGIDYRDWSDRYPTGRFLDHCHLTAAGNREYAGELARLIEE